jgi:predicted AAA+ superfamily ATPase
MYPRHAESRIREALTDTRVVAIAGPRQSGKTTLARKIAGETHSYLTLDDPAVLAAATSDPSGLIRRLDRAVIDEIQRAPNLTLAVKQAVDEDQRPGRFLITGSADILAMPKAAESLAGRIEIAMLLPLSRSEIAGRPPPLLIAQAFDGSVLNVS